MKTRKIRLLSALLALAMMLALLPTAAFAAGESTYTYQWNTDHSVTFKYTLDSENKATITGVDGNLPADGVVVIPAEIGGKPVIAIGKKAFYGCSSVTAVTIPDSVESIGESAFSGDFQGNVKAPRITEIKIPSGVKTIGKYAFAYCYELKTVDLNSACSLKTIEDYAFQCCTNLEKIDLEHAIDLETIGNGAISAVQANGSMIGPKIVQITIPKGVKTIGTHFLARCVKLENVTFAPDSELETIGENAFKDCSALQTISCDESVKQVLTNAGVSADKIKPADPTVMFDSNDGSAVAAQKVEYNTPVAEPTAPTKEDYIFAGWYTKNESGKWADKPFDFSTPIMDNMTLYARWGVEATPIGPATQLYPITIDYGTAYDAEGNPITKAAAGDVVTIEASETALEGMTFERWEVRKGNVKLENDRAAKTSFTMPEGEVQLEAMYQAADVEDSGWDAATVVTGAVIGTGTAILAYHIGMEVYAEQVLGKDVAVPRTRAEVALLAWQLAGSPAVNVEGEPLSEAAQAQRWAVESGLMQKDAQGNFNGTKKMSKWNALRTLDAAKKMG